MFGHSAVDLSKVQFVRAGDRLVELSPSALNFDFERHSPFGTNRSIDAGLAPRKWGELLAMIDRKEKGELRVRATAAMTHGPSGPSGYRVSLGEHPDFRR